MALHRLALRTPDPAGAPTDIAVKVLLKCESVRSARIRPPDVAITVEAETSDDAQAIVMQFVHARFERSARRAFSRPSGLLDLRTDDE